jgi:uncharacterized protein with ATP-grasp and redox domains
LQTYPECIPCFLKQAVEVSHIINANRDLSRKILFEVLKETSDISWEVSPPENFCNIFRVIKKVSKNKDPYLKLKREYNNKALKLYPELKKIVANSKNPLEVATKLAIAGNIIDFGMQSKIADLGEVVKETLLNSPSINDFNLFYNYLKESKSILYLADNCGEIIFDRILLEEITKIKSYDIFFIVRGAPALNDVLEEDAYWAGIDHLAYIISNGYDAPATILSKCIKEVRELFSKADIIISKGQGNFEALENEDKNIFFILKVKCNVVADYLKVCVGDSLLFKKGD